MSAAVRGALLALLVLGVVGQHGVSAGFFDSVRGGLAQVADTVVKPVRDLFRGRDSPGDKNTGAVDQLTRAAAKVGGVQGPAAGVAPPTTTGGSAQLLQKFKAQSDSLPSVDVGASAQKLLQPLSKLASSGASLLGSLLSLSLVIKGELSAPKSGYSEPYTVRYDPGTGASRVDFNGGTTSSYLVPLKDGRVQSVQVREERWGARAVRRCLVGEPHNATAADRALAALPDLGLFNFAGVTEGGAQRWLHTAIGKAGEFGAAPGEALSFKHELLFVDSVAGIPLPTKYSVSVDSSVLGAACDGFAHQYKSVLVQPHEPSVFDPQLSACDATETVTSASPQQLATLNPLREFTMEHRDTRYDSMLDQFKISNALEYIDNIEEALRKTLLMQHSRFVESINRRGLPFLLETNFLADRLDEELAVLRGGSEDDGAGDQAAGGDGASPVAKRSAPDALPKEFDWRDRGAVTPVDYQGNCSSCWAFAVAGAVEGAAFVRSGSLVPLSLQALIDCGRPYGANGCRGTWPERAYAYVSARGLPAASDYPPYSAEVQSCRAPGEAAGGAATRIAGYMAVPPGDQVQLQRALAARGPAVVVVDAKPKTFLFYKSGVLVDDTCGTTKKQLNHAVLAVGWGEKDGEPHFILKNSWSAKWGDGGYIRVAARGNTCGVLTLPSYPMVV